MKKAYSVALVFSLFLTGCQAENRTKTESEVAESTDVSSEEKTDGNLVAFEGFVVEKKIENGREMALVVNGISEKEAKNLSFYEVTGEVHHDNILWFTSDKYLFSEIEAGEKVEVIWDTSIPHAEPSIITVEAVKVEKID